MGLTGSRVVSKLASSWSGGGEDEADAASAASAELNRALARHPGGPFVYSRRGSMYFDEDGDLAHEFYEEVLPKRRGGTRRMKKIHSKHLTPQGEVPYKHPRLHVDLPIILYQG